MTAGEVRTLRYLIDSLSNFSFFSQMKEFDESDDSIKDFVTDGSDTASSTSSDEGSGSMSGSDEEYKPSSTRRVTRGLKQSGAVTGKIIFKIVKCSFNLW